jgi:hypothetical protein
LIAEWQKKTLGPAEKAYLPSKRTMRRKVNRHKQEAKGHPPCPKSFQDLANMPEKYCQTFDGNLFLLANLELNGERMLIYCSNNGLKMLRKGETWSMDGTFAVVKPPFCQLYSIMSEIDGYSYPCLFAFLANKKSPTYRLLMETVYQKVTEKGVLALRQVVLDFEGPVLKEFRSVFGPHIRITGCIVHFSRSIRRKQGKLGGLITWMTKPGFKIFNQCLKALAYVPPPHLAFQYYQCLLGEELNSVCTELDEDKSIKPEEADRMKENLNNYLDFFEKNYIGRKARTGFIKGKFPIQLWSQYENVLEGRQTSTNAHEGFHSRLRKAVPHSATFWSLLDQLIDYEATARADREMDLDNGPAEDQPGSSRRKKEMRKEARERLRHNVLDYEQYEMADYLNKVGSFKGHL